MQRISNTGHFNKVRFVPIQDDNTAHAIVVFRDCPTMYIENNRCSITEVFTSCFAGIFNQ